MTNQIPDIGDRFERDGRTYRVDGWLKPTVRRVASRDVGPDRCPLVFCAREEAIYVAGSGVAGMIVRAEDVQVIGRVDWSPDVFDEARRNAEWLIGQEAR